MLDTPITRAEHEEFRRRIEDEHIRQNRRLELLEESIERLNALNTSIEKIGNKHGEYVKRADASG